MNPVPSVLPRGRGRAVAGIPVYKGPKWTQPRSMPRLPRVAMGGGQARSGQKTRTSNRRWGRGRESSSSRESAAPHCGRRFRCYCIFHRNPKVVLKQRGSVSMTNSLVSWLLLACSFTITGSAIAFATTYGFSSTEFLTIKAWGMTASVALAGIPVYYLAKIGKLKGMMFFRVTTVATVLSMAIWFF